MRLRFVPDPLAGIPQDVNIKVGKLTAEFDSTEVLAGVGLVIWLLGELVDGFKQYQWVGYVLLAVWVVLVVLITFGGGAAAGQEAGQPRRWRERRERQRATGLGRTSCRLT
jgi:uncharacterized membrane protein YcjF (UPF0283 family)